MTVMSAFEKSTYATTECCYYHLVVKKPKNYTLLLACHVP